MSKTPSTPSLADRFFVEAMSPAFREDPYAYYERFRGPSPLLRVAETIWFALGHADVTTLLRHPRMSTDEQQHAATEAGNALDPNRTRSLLFMDPPDHTRLRNLVARAFTPRRIEGLRAATAAITAELLDAMPADGTPVDLIPAFAYPLPVRVICRLLGIPEADEAVFTGWSHGIARSLDPSVLRSPAIDATIDQARSELRAYLGALLEFRRKSPGDDLLSGLAAVDADGDRISSGEVLSLAVLLLVAGHETTVNLIGNGMLALLRAPDQLALLRRSPELVGGAVDELLRFDGPVQITQRIATEDMEVVGCQVRRGDEILLVLGAANRDPAVFAEPDRLDVTRDARRHVGFGGGIHHCLGAVLARMETQIALAALLERFGRIELAGAPVRRPTFTLRGLESLPIAL
ncbi:MAG TPA: cytochrome P450 [Reyranella sp.]|jgi:cytochrome P450|nr:cytochrome P450 [Reyranella sp.]